MTQRTGSGPAAGTGFEHVWQVPDAQVASGRIPGYVAAVRIRGQVAVRAGGRTAVETESTPMGEDTLFRIASVTKPIGGALTLSLVQDGALALDDPIARWLPEAASPRVLVAPGAPLDRTTELGRPITVAHLLTLTCGWGAVLEEIPLRSAMMERGVYPGPLTPQMSGDEFVARVARLATAYQPGPGGLEVLDPPDGVFAGPPGFEELSSGLVSTAPDLLRFFCAMADGGGPVLTAGSVALMTADALTDAQRRQALPIVGPGGSWGLATGVDVEAAEPWMAPGRWGRDGGTGTTAHVDPARGTVGVLLTQRAMTGPLDGFGDFWTAVAAAA